jgi:serine/threonine protein kinase
MPTPDVPIPDIPDLDLIRMIGSGGFGRVWLATNRTTGRLRAVKVIPLRRSGETDRAGREISSITRLEENVRTDHPCLLRIYHVGRTDEYLFYVMDPADDIAGGKPSRREDYRPATLRSRLDTGPLSPSQCLDVARQLLEGLASLHAAGMVHRDVKPANCLFVDGTLKLADFGLLTAASPQVSRMGTEKYMPPDGRMDTRADVYAAGLVIYEMLTGLPADDFPCPGERAREIAADPLLTRLNRLVLQACEPDPQRRFADARAMLAELNEPIRPSAPRPTWNRRRTIAAAACLFVAGSAMAIALWPGPTAQSVHVNFISHPLEATIYLDGEQLLDSDGLPEKTPCTVLDLSPKVHRVVFKRPGHSDLDAGEFDFAKTREIEVTWKIRQ